MGRLSQFSFLALTCCLLTAGCRVVPDEYPGLPIPPPPPATADSTQVPNDSAHWRHYDLGRGAFETPSPGHFEFESDGVHGYNSSPGFGSILSTAETYALDNREIRVTWMCNDAGNSSDFALALADSSGLLYDPANSQPLYTDLNKLSTRSAYSGGTEVRNNVWYFSSIRSNGGQYTVSTYYNGFPDEGGILIETKSGPLPFRRGRVLLRSNAPARAGCLLVINRLSVR